MSFNFRLFRVFFSKNESKTVLVNMEIAEMNICLCKFYKTAGRKDGSYEKSRA